jgi:hypothetical protein
MLHAAPLLTRHEACLLLRCDWLRIGDIASEPDDVMSRDFFEEPIGALLIQPIERDRAFHAVVVGAGRSYVDRRTFVAGLPEKFGGIALFDKKR